MGTDTGLVSSPLRGTDSQERDGGAADPPDCSLEAFAVKSPLSASQKAYRGVGTSLLESSGRLALLQSLGWNRLATCRRAAS